MESVVKKNELDLEWMKLIKEALEIGIPKEEIQAFLQSPQSRSLTFVK